MALVNIAPWYFDDKNKCCITSYERVQYLIGRGFLFEACAVLSLVLESMLFHTILLKSIDKTPSDKNQIQRKVGRKPMGILIDICQEYDLFPSQFTQQLKDYKEKRNSLIHHHLPRLEKFDYKSFIEESNVLIETLFKQIRPVMKKMEKRSSEIGHPDAKKT